MRTHTLYFFSKSHACIYIHVYIHTYIHTYIRTYVRTYTRTYIHTYMHAGQCPVHKSGRMLLREVCSVAGDLILLPALTVCLAHSKSTQTCHQRMGRLVINTHSSWLKFRFL